MQLLILLTMRLNSHLTPLKELLHLMFPKSSNPFDSVGNTSINPFEISQNKVPSNPFDQLSHQSSENTVSQLNKG